MTDSLDDIKDVKIRIDEFKTIFLNFEKKIEVYQQLTLTFNGMIASRASANNNLADFRSFVSLSIALVSMAVTGFLSNSLSSSTAKSIIAFGITVVLIMGYFNFRDFMSHRKHANEFATLIEQLVSQNSPKYR